MLGKRPNDLILFLGASGFPHRKEATVSRIQYLSRALIDADYRVLVLSRKGRSDKSRILASKGIVNGIYYRFATSSPYYEENFVRRNILKLYGFFSEFGIIFSKRIRGESKVAFVYSHSLIDLIYYRFLSKLLFIKIVTNVTEELCSRKVSNQGWLEKINNVLFDRLIVKRLADGVIPISTYLESKIHGKLKKKCLKVPPLFDYHEYDYIVKELDPKNKYFVFCGAIAYKEVIINIIEGFKKIQNKEVRLVLILAGETKEIDSLIPLFNSQIDLLQGISFEQLYKLYINSIGLLAPLRSTVQDIARFPNKIAEYLATGTPIISSEIGEMKCYFKDKKNIYYSQGVDSNALFEIMEKVLLFPEIAEKIGKEGKEVGLKNFHYQIYSNKLGELIKTL